MDGGIRLSTLLVFVVGMIVVMSVAGLAKWLSEDARFEWRKMRIGSWVIFGTGKQRHTPVSRTAAVE